MTQAQTVLTLKDRLLGAWTLQSYRETNLETGEVSLPMGEHPLGYIMYTPQGFMSAQISAADRSKFSGNDMFGGTPEEYIGAGQSYLAYAGPFEVDEVASRVSHKIEISLYPNWAGMNQVRIITLDQDRLTLSFEQPQLSRGALRSADLVWKRL